MEPEEAIIAIELIREMKVNVPITQVDITNTEWAQEIAVEALEKQIPKKVKNIRFSRDYELAEHNIMEGECPECGETMTGNTFGEYCGSCGVALDWGNED